MGSGNQRLWLRHPLNGVSLNRNSIGSWGQDEWSLEAANLPLPHATPPKKFCTQFSSQLWCWAQWGSQAPRDTVGGREGNRGLVF